MPNDRIATCSDVHMLDCDLLLTFAAMLVQCLHLPQVQSAKACDLANVHRV